MSKIQRVLSEMKKQGASIERLCYLLRAAGGPDGQELAAAVGEDYASTPEPFSFDPTDLASLPQSELLDGAKQLGEELTDANKRELAAHMLALAVGLDPDKPEQPNTSAVTLDEPTRR